jgi:hypothetical protein
MPIFYFTECLFTSRKFVIVILSIFACCFGQKSSNVFGGDEAYEPVQELDDGIFNL